MGVKGYNLVARPKNDLVKVLCEHLKPKLLITERFKFYKREDSVIQYLVTSKPLVTHCDFDMFLNDGHQDTLI